MGNDILTGVYLSALFCTMVYGIGLSLHYKLVVRNDEMTRIPMAVAALVGTIFFVSLISIVKSAVH